MNQCSKVRIEVDHFVLNEIDLTEIRSSHNTFGSFGSYWNCQVYNTKDKIL